MKQEVLLEKDIYGSATYKKVVDTEFTQLLTPVIPTVEDFTVDQFFRMYEALFYQIPIDGEQNTHEYLVRRSQEYIGASVLTNNEKALLDEINSLRQQLLESNKSLTDIAKLT